MSLFAAEDHELQILWTSGLPLTLWQGRPLAPMRSPARDFQMVLKRVIDVALSCVALVAVWPLMLIVAVAIWLSSPGPVLFGQMREGTNGAMFRTWKFRSMRTELGDASGVAHTLRGDPRVTRVGRLIRRTSIDELPQLFNVLLGEMSIVGPRPHVAGMLAGGERYDQLVPYYRRRLQMQPGITGWAQANGLRGLVDSEYSARARVDHDLAYIQNFSVALDFRIILLTIRREFVTGTGH